MVEGSVEAVLREVSRAPDPSTLRAATQVALATATRADETAFALVPTDEPSMSIGPISADSSPAPASRHLDLVLHHCGRHATTLLCRRHGSDFGPTELTLARRVVPGIRAIWEAMSHRQQTLRLARLVASGEFAAGTGVILIGHRDIDILDLTDIAVAALQQQHQQQDSTRELCVGAAIPEPLHGLLRNIRGAVATGVAGGLSHVISGSTVHVHPADPGFGGEVVLVRARPRSPLTARQLEVMALVDEGQSNKQIAARLSISIATVKKHLQTTYVALGVTSRTAALRRLSVDGPWLARGHAAMVQRAGASSPPIGLWPIDDERIARIP